MTELLHRVGINQSSPWYSNTIVCSGKHTLVARDVSINENEKKLRRKQQSNEN